MQAVREMIKTKSRDCSIRLPEWAVGQELEVIILPFKRQVGVKAKRAGGSLARFAGAWRGEEMVREEQGAYEVRNELK
ncbi:MAG: hypothetical protein DRH08_07130 [Deltaproteobacteria bacterium]|nr:MAG: hypothetical protein DRH08_07130 [Deltaproteobacteria bacterium]